MNLRLMTGWLPEDAATSYTPATAEAPAQRKLLFEVNVKDSRGMEFPEKCLIDEAELIGRYEAKLTAGTAVIVQGEPTALPFYERGVLKGYSRKVRVQSIEFPRGVAKQKDTAA